MNWALVDARKQRYKKELYCGGKRKEEHEEGSGYIFIHDQSIYSF